MWILCRLNEIAYPENQSTWGVTGGHYEEQPVTTWGITGGHWETQDTLIPEQRTSVTESVYGLPVVRFTGQSPDIVWSWRNADREILELTTAGVSLPHPSDLTGASRAVLTATQFEQSYTSPGNLPTYLSHGLKMTKDSLEAWHEEGDQTSVSNSNVAKFKPGEIVMTESVPAEEGTSTVSRITRIAASNSEFGGNVSVKGILRVQRAGNVSMGIFTNGPQP